MDWLYRVEPQLAEDQPVHGDLDLVSNLMDSHKVRSLTLSLSSQSESQSLTPPVSTCRLFRRSWVREPAAFRR